MENKNNNSFIKEVNDEIATIVYSFFKSYIEIIEHFYNKIEEFSLKNKKNNDDIDYYKKILYNFMSVDIEQNKDYKINDNVIKTFVNIVFDTNEKNKSYNKFIENLNYMKVYILNYSYEYYKDFIIIIDDYISLFKKFYNIGKELDNKINEKYKNNTTFLLLLTNKLNFNNNNFYYVSLPGYKEFIKNIENFLLKLKNLDNKELKETEIEVAKKLQNISKFIISSNSEKLYLKSINFVKEYLKNNESYITSISYKNKLSENNISIIINSLNSSIELCKYFDEIFNKIITNIETIYKNMDFEKISKNIILKDTSSIKSYKEINFGYEDNDEDNNDIIIKNYDYIDDLLDETKFLTNGYITIIENTISIVNGFFNTNIDPIKLIEVYFNYIFINKAFIDPLYVLNLNNFMNGIDKYIDIVEIIKNNLYKIISAIFNLISLLYINDKKDFINKFKIIIGGDQSGVYNIFNIDEDNTNIFNLPENFINELKNLYFEIPIIFIGLKNIISNINISNIDKNNEIFNKYSKWYFLHKDEQTDYDVNDIIKNINFIYNSSNKNIDNIKKDFLNDIIESIKGYIISDYNIINSDDINENINLNIDIIANKLKKVNNYSEIINSVNDLLILYENFNKLLNKEDDDEDEKIKTNNYVNTYYNLYISKINKSIDNESKKTILTNALKHDGDFKNININHIYIIKESLIGFLKSSISSYRDILIYEDDTIPNYTLYDILVNDFNNYLNITKINKDEIKIKLNKSVITNNIIDYISKYNDINRNFIFKTNVELEKFKDEIDIDNFNDIEIEDDNNIDITFVYPINNYDLNDIRLKFKPDENFIKQPDNISLYTKNISTIAPNTTFVDFYNSIYLPFEYQINYNNKYYYFAYILENINNLNFGLYNISNNNIMITEFIEIFSKNNIQFINNTQAKNNLIFNNPIPNYIEINTNIQNNNIEKLNNDEEYDILNNIGNIINFSKKKEIIYNVNTHTNIYLPFFLFYIDNIDYIYDTQGTDNSYIYIRRNNNIDRYFLNYRGHVSIMQSLISKQNIISNDYCRRIINIINENLENNKTNIDDLLRDFSDKKQAYENYKSDYNKDQYINARNEYIKNKYFIIHIKIPLDLPEDLYSEINYVNYYIPIDADKKQYIVLAFEININNSVNSANIVKSDDYNIIGMSNRSDIIQVFSNTHISQEINTIYNDENILTNISIYNLFYKTDYTINKDLYTIKVSESKFSDIFKNLGNYVYQYTEKLIKDKLIMNKYIGNIIEERKFINPYINIEQNYNESTEITIKNTDDNEKEINILTSVMNLNDDWSQLPLYFKTTINSFSVSDKIMISDNFISPNMLSDILFSIMYSLNCANNIKQALNLIPDKQNINIYNRFTNIYRNIDYLIKSLEECILLLVNKTNNKVIEYLFTDEEKEILSFKNVIGYDQINNEKMLNKIFLKLFFINKYIKNIKFEDILTIFSKTIIDNNDLNIEVYNQTIKYIIKFYYLLFNTSSNTTISDNINNVNSDIYKDLYNNKLNEDINIFSEKFIKYFNIQIETPLELFNKTGFPNIYLLSYTDDETLLNVENLNLKLLNSINFIINKINNIKNVKQNNISLKSDYNYLYNLKTYEIPQELNDNSISYINNYIDNKIININEYITNNSNKISLLFDFINQFDIKENRYSNIVRNFLLKYKLNNEIVLDNLIDMIKKNNLNNNNLNDINNINDKLNNLNNLFNIN